MDETPLSYLTGRDLASLKRRYIHWLIHHVGSAGAAYTVGEARAAVVALYEGLAARGGNQATVTVRMDLFDTSVPGCRSQALDPLSPVASAGQPLVVSAEIAWQADGALGCDIGDGLLALLGVASLYGGWVSLTPRLPDGEAAGSATVWRLAAQTARIVLSEVVSETCVPGAFEFPLEGNDE